MPTLDLQDLPVSTERKASETRRTVINVCNTSKGEMYVKRQCMHCNEPACAAACLTQAMYKTKEGPVIWRATNAWDAGTAWSRVPSTVPNSSTTAQTRRLKNATMCYPRLTGGKAPGLC
ncbi:MAG: hypothetical protein MZV63_25340 [Marinilabiliales bacterium]|nr:hypothetical protein [Marinilabiliales bacterium]